MRAIQYPRAFETFTDAGDYGLPAFAGMAAFCKASALRLNISPQETTVASLPENGAIMVLTA
jgi:hypothetical protein